MAKRPPGEPMTLGNMRHLGVQRLVATCLNDACRHQGLIDVSKHPDDVAVPWFANKVVCAMCGARGGHVDVRPKMKAAKEFQDNWNVSYMKNQQDNWNVSYMKTVKDFQDNFATSYMK